MAEITQSPNDRRQYSYIQVPNGLKAVLISETQSLGDEDETPLSVPSKAAAGLCVGVGSLHDPEVVKGMAHMLEHMLYLGNSKHPAEGDFDDIINSYSGSSDATTDWEQMNFSIDVDSKYLEDALACFAACFSDPLLRRELISKEVEAVESEFRIGLPKDKNRIAQILQNLARDNHPISKFKWGNTETLDSKPKAAGVDLCEEMKIFHKKYFTADRMTLAVYSRRHSVDELEKLVMTNFSAIQSSCGPKTDFADAETPYEVSSFNRLLRVISAEKTKKVVLTWCLPSQQSHYRAKPLHYVRFLLGHEGQGSVAAYLRKRNWIYDVKAGHDAELHNTSLCSFFQVTVTLRDEGFDHVFEVISVILQYILYLQTRGPSRQVFDELQLIENNGFQWLEQTTPMECVQELALSMQLYERKDILTGSTLFTEFNEQLIRDCADALCPSKMNILIVADSYDSIVCDLQCPWFNTRYAIEEFPNDWVSKWAALELNPELHLPPPNVYIAKNFSLKEADSENTEYTSPVTVSHSTYSRVWHKKDETYKVPRAYIYAHLTGSLINKSASSMSMADLMVNLVEKNLIAVSCDAKSADLTYAVQVKLGGIEVRINGFDENISKFFHTVMNQVINLNFTEADFEFVKEEMRMDALNQLLETSVLNRDLQLSVLVHNHWTISECLLALETITYEDLKKFIQELYSALRVDMLVEGNYTAQESRLLEQWLLSQLNTKSRPPSSTSASTVDSTQADYLVTELPKETVVHRAKSRNENDNCMITNYYQHGAATIKEYQMMELLLMKMSTPLFSTLRTNLQLGYNVSCSPCKTHGIIGYSIAIESQSSKFSMNHLDDKIEEFLVSRQSKLDQWLSESAFKSMVQSQISNKTNKNVNLEEDADDNWSEVLEGSFLFDRSQQEVEELKRLTLPEFREWCCRHLLEGEERRKLSVQVVGYTHDEKTGMKTLRKEDAIPTKSRDAHGNVFIHDIMQFKASCRKYRATKIV